MIRSDVVGSLIRPEYLERAWSARESGELAPADYKRIEDRAVDEAIALQASTLQGNRLTAADQAAEVRRVAEVAREVWAESVSRS